MGFEGGTIRDNMLAEVENRRVWQTAVSCRILCTELDCLLPGVDISDQLLRWRDAMTEASNQHSVKCRVKWFDSRKGFGFLVPIEGGPDILLHANVLRNAGRGSIAENVLVAATVSQVDGRWQATALGALQVEASLATPKLEQFSSLDPEALRSLTYQPARVKWFDQSKGFGFANAFGSLEDIFIHAEVLRASGLAGLETGEAVALKVIVGERGRIAAEVAEWDRSLG